MFPTSLRRETAGKVSHHTTRGDTCARADEGRNSRRRYKVPGKLRFLCIARAEFNAAAFYNPPSPSRLPFPCSPRFPRNLYDAATVFTAVLYTRMNTLVASTYSPRIAKLTINKETRAFMKKKRKSARTTQ